MRMSLFCLLSRMDPPQEAVDETVESVNPLDPSASGPSESTMHENASTEALIKVSQDMARVLDRLTASRARVMQYESMEWKNSMVQVWKNPIKLSFGLKNLKGF